MAKALSKPIAKPAPVKAAPAKPAPAAPVAPVAPVAAVPPHWLQIARKYIGVHEGDGLHNNPTVMKFFVEAGHAEVRNDHTTPWCAAFVGAVLKESGLPNTGTLWALDYARYGQKLAGPAIGAIGTKTRNGGGHVFFVAGFDRNFIYALGGNQNDRVCIERIPRAAIHSYAWPPGLPLPALVASGGAQAGAAGASEA